MTDSAFVTVFTMTYNQRSKIVRLAQDLARQDYAGNRFEFVVLDDGSTDGTTAALGELHGSLPYRLCLLRRDHDADYLSARRWNECIAGSSPESSVFVQVDDVRVRPDFVSRHLAWHSGSDLVLVTGSKFEGDTETWELSTCRRAHLAGPHGASAETTLWTAFWGASLSYSRALVDALVDGPDQPFDTRMAGWGFQEVEFAYRATRAGARLIYDPAVGVFHQNHSPASDVGRGIDHASRKATGEVQNAAYVLAKHGLAELPRW